MNKYHKKIAKLEAKAAAQDALNKYNRDHGIVEEPVDQKVKRVIITPACRVAGVAGKIICHAAKGVGKGVALAGSGLLYASDKDHRAVVDAERLIKLANKQGRAIHMTTD